MLLHIRRLALVALELREHVRTLTMERDEARAVLADKCMEDSRP